MKTKILLIIACILLCQSCRIYWDIHHYLFHCFTCMNNVEPKINKIVLDIYDHPEKLKDIKENYPEFYDSKIIYSQLKDPSYINKLIKSINGIKKEKACNELFNHGIGDDLTGYGYPENIMIEQSKRYLVFLLKDKIFIDFFFIRENDTLFKIFDIRGGPGVIDHYGIDSNVEFLINDVYENPEKLRDIKGNYPEFYDSSLIYKNLKDSIYLNKLIKSIKNFNKEGGDNELIYTTPSGNLEGYGYPKNINIEISKRYGVLLFKKEHHRGGKFFYFLFVNENDTIFKLFDIRIED
jgi:hypothetical protein